MNKIYDFDGTIIKGHIVVPFYLSCLKENPGLVIYGPKNAFNYTLYKLNALGIDGLSYDFCKFVSKIEDLDEKLEEFCAKNIDRVYDWYKEAYHETDIILSTSPEFILKPFFKRFGIKNIIGTRFDTKTGILIGKPCFKSEKLRRFREEFPKGQIDVFTTDSIVQDKPLIDEAKEAYQIVKGKPIRIK